MGRKNKKRRFAENATFTLLHQPEFEEIFKNDYNLKGKWNANFFENKNPIILELGCGKGEYTIALAQMFPQKNFIGVDIKGARMWRGAKTATEAHMNNVAFIRTRIEFIKSFFAQNEIDEIWITFPDPQIKKSRAAKRLTSAAFLNSYRNFLKPDGIINLKTDSRFLHEYTKCIIADNNLRTIFACDDIYGKNCADEILSIKTAYETEFLSKGLPITYLKFTIDGNAQINTPTSFDEDKAREIFGREDKR